VASQVRRIFCSPDTRLLEDYEWRGTRFLASRSQVKIYKVMKGAKARSRYMHYESVMGAGVNCKNRDKFIYFALSVLADVFN
jgi:hypothetical protein